MDRNFSSPGVAVNSTASSAVLQRFSSLLSCFQKVFLPNNMRNVSGGPSRHDAYQAQQRALLAARNQDDHDFDTHNYSDKDQEEFEETSESLFHTILILVTFSVVVVLLVIRSTRGGYCAACQVPADFTLPSRSRQATTTVGGQLLVVPTMEDFSSLGHSHVLGESEFTDPPSGRRAHKRESIVVWVNEMSPPAAMDVPRGSK
ncbi:hypothetical protein BV898_09461 [Hypsibius exemplaris]|uniref:Uncharacterized protein n=1 Tax=Hypsibius exemplaris TaxID=2072580 RepID=A0A1W0WMM8_HYPEX|nr:hypothetical protein BV898_09461 [Hypsibius exemplaris]